MKKPNLTFKITPTVAGMVRGMVLCVVWGLALFTWFSMGVWATRQYADALRAPLAAHTADVVRLLAELEAPLGRISTDPTLTLGLALPLNVESLPVQRALNMAATQNPDREFYVLDTATGRMGKSAEASPFPPTVLARLAAWPEDEGRALLGIGRRSGMVYMAERLGNKPELWLAMSLTLPEMTAHWPAFELPDGQHNGLLLPHTGGTEEVAELSTETLQFHQNQAMALYSKGHGTFYMDDTGTMTSPLPVTGWPGVYLTVGGPFGAATWLMLARMGVLLVALLTTGALFWRASAPLRQKANAAFAPLQAKIGGKLGAGKGVRTAPVAHGGVDLKEAPKADFAGVDMKASAKADAPGPVDWDRKEAAIHGPQEPNGMSGDTQVDAGPAPVVVTVKEERKKRRWKAPQAHTDGTPAPKPDATKQEDAEKKEPSMTMKAIIEKCIAENRLELHYQPIYRVEDSQPILHEVYLRLLGPDGALIMPGDFLPTATQFNLTLPLDVAVLRKLQATFFVGTEVPSTPLAINLSASSLEGLDYLKEVVRTGPRMLQRLALEVRSQEMVRDARAMKLLKEIQRYGGHVAVDYFGGGASMMEAAKAMGFDYVKVDAEAMLDKQDGQHELETLCHQANLLGMPVIVEKVGHMSTETIARKAGATYIQGFSLCKPKKTLTHEPLPPRVAGLAALVNTAMEETL